MHRRSFSWAVFSLTTSKRYLSSKNCDDIVIKINLDLENIRKWMLRNKLQIHPTKSKYMFIGSAYNIKHKLSANPILINNVPIPRTENYICLGVNIDERLTWEKHIDMMFKSQCMRYRGYKAY